MTHVVHECLGLTSVHEWCMLYVIWGKRFLAMTSWVAPSSCCWHQLNPWLMSRIRWRRVAESNKSAPRSFLSFFIELGKVPRSRCLFLLSGVAISSLVLHKYRGIALHTQKRHTHTNVVRVSYEVSCPCGGNPFTCDWFHICSLKDTDTKTKSRKISKTL